ncbi:MAG: hypothetical protein ACKPGB_03510 [Dolichospermum sp.]
MLTFESSISTVKPTVNCADIRRNIQFFINQVN